MNLKIYIKDIRKTEDINNMGTLLSLPASEECIREALMTEGIPANTDEYLLIAAEVEGLPESTAHKINQAIIDQPAILALNLLAFRLSAANPFELDTFDYLVVHDGKSQIKKENGAVAVRNTMAELLNYTFNMDCCHCVDSITSYKELVFSRLPDDIAMEIRNNPRPLDEPSLSRFGYQIAIEEGGWCTSSGYLTYNNEHQWVDIFDGSEPFFVEEFNRDQAERDRQAQLREVSQKDMEATTLQVALTEFLSSNEYQYELDTMTAEYMCYGLPKPPQDMMTALLMAMEKAHVAPCMDNGHRYTEFADGENGSSTLYCEQCGESQTLFW